MMKSKKYIYIFMLLLVLVVCFMPSFVAKDGEVPREYSGTDTTASEVTTTEITTEAIVTENATTEEFVYISEDAKIEAKIEEILSTMTIEEKAGQLFFIKNDNRFDETILVDYPVGGIILFASDFAGETPESLTAEISAFQAASKYPLFIGTDEEGGDVVRLSRYSNLAESQFRSPRYLYDMGGYDAIYSDTVYKSELLLSYGINVNFAPVCDVSLNPDEYMYKRSFGRSVIETAEYVRIVVSAMEQEGIGNVLKHFPGYGGNGDTHTYIVRDDRLYEEFLMSDFVPFVAGIEEGADCVLISHNIVECMDPDWPASLSYEVNRILREDMGFEGVIITDDLMMSGVSDYVSDEESVVRAVLVGNDMILSTDFQIQYEALLQAVYDGTITEERLDESVRRILKWKYELGIIE
ncbi:MAG: beta-hexosaminidase [Lachnospiraceae bacterium]|nr:beta-hexosaminidase [Lachnospiraceae bacterium]